MIVSDFRHKKSASPKVTSVWSWVKTRNLLSYTITAFLFLVLHVITSMALSKEDFLSFMKENQIEREKEIQTLTTMVKEGVRDEVRQAVTTIVAKQNLLEDQQNCLEQEHSSLKTRVGFLESELASIKNNPHFSGNNFHPLKSASTAPIVAEPLPDSKSIDDTTEALNVLREAKKVLGFSPISIEYLEHLKELHSIDDDFEAKQYSIREFLEF